jgi:hypothetical protein
VSAFRENLRSPARADDARRHSQGKPPHECPSIPCTPPTRDSPARDAPRPPPGARRIARARRSGSSRRVSGRRGTLGRRRLDLYSRSRRSGRRAAGLNAFFGNQYIVCPNGDARYFQDAPGDPAGPMQVATIRFMSGGDSIFADGFDG